MLRALTLSLTLIVVAPAEARTPCAFEPGQGSGWSYRTKVDGKNDMCWYRGAKMRDRKLLYWPAPIEEPEPLAAPTFDSIWRDLLSDMIPLEWYNAVPVIQWRSIRSNR